MADFSLSYYQILELARGSAGKTFSLLIGKARQGKVKFQYFLSG